MADATKFKADQTLRGSSGRLWINEALFLNVKKFEVKIKGVYEDVDSCNHGKDRVLVGYEVSGSLVTNKVDSYFAKLLADAWKKLETPELTFVGKIDSPSASGQESIRVTGVTFDDFGFSFEVKKLAEEDHAFEASDYEFVDTI